MNNISNNSISPMQEFDFLVAKELTKPGEETQSVKQVVNPFMKMLKDPKVPADISDLKSNIGQAAGEIGEFVKGNKAVRTLGGFIRKKSALDPHNPYTWPPELRKKYMQAFIKQITPSQDKSLDQPAQGDIFTPVFVTPDGKLEVGAFSDTPYKIKYHPSGIPIIIP